MIGILRPTRRSLDTGGGGGGAMEHHVTHVTCQHDDTDSDSENAYSDHRHHHRGSGGGAQSTGKKKTLAQGMKEKLPFLRRRGHGRDKDGLEKPTPEVALSWSKGIYNLLNDKYGLDLFRDFLRTEFSEENIEFWVACEEYKHAKASAQPSAAQLIYSDFVAVQAPREVNLDSKTRLLTLDNMQTPDKDTFEAAQKRIQNLMEKDSYPRFLSSDVYKDLLGDYRDKVKIKS